MKIPAIAKAISIGALLAVPSCTSSGKNCNINNNDPEAAQVSSLIDATKQCTSGRVLKCLADPSSYTKDMHEQDIDCSSPDANKQIGDMFSDSDLVICYATAHPYEVQIVCK